MALVGRSAELRELDHLLDRAAAGSGAVLTIVGSPGSGKTTLLAAAAGEARRRGFEVLAGAQSRGRPGRLVWAQLLRHAGVAEQQVVTFLGSAAPLEVSLEVSRLVGAVPRLLVIDDLDLGGDEALDVLTVLAARLVASQTAVLVTASAPLGVGARAALARIAEQAPRAGAHLEVSVRTGLACRYDPGPGGPSGWNV